MSEIDQNGKERRKEKKKRKKRIFKKDTWLKSGQWDNGSTFELKRKEVKRLKGRRSGGNERTEIL